MYANLALENKAIKAVLKNCSVVRPPGCSFAIGEGSVPFHQTILQTGESVTRRIAGKRTVCNVRCAGS